MTAPGSAHAGTRLAAGSAQTFAASLAVRALAMAHSVVIARWLAPPQVGVLAIVSYVLSLAGAVADLGTPAAAVKLVAEYRTARRPALRGLLATLGAVPVLTAGIVALVLFVGSHGLARFYGEPLLGGLFQLAACLLFVSVLGGVLWSVLQGFQRIGLLAVLGPLKGLGALAATIALLPLLGMAGVLVAGIGAELLIGLIAVRPLRQALGPPDPHDRPVVSWEALRRSFDVALPVFLNGLALWGTAWLLRTYLAQTRGYAEVGYFQVADALSRALLLIPAAVAVPFLPLLSAAATRPDGRAQAMGHSALRATMLVTLPAALFLFLSAHVVTVALYGDAYASAGGVTALLATAAFVQSLNIIVWSTLIGTGWVWAGFAVNGAGHALVVALLPTLVAAHGAGGAAAAQVLGASLTLALGLGVLALGIGIRLDDLRALGAIALALWLAAWGLEATGQAGLVAAVLVALIALALVWTNLTREETGRVREALERLRGGRGQ